MLDLVKTSGFCYFEFNFPITVSNAALIFPIASLRALSFELLFPVTIMGCKPSILASILHCMSSVPALGHSGLKGVLQCGLFCRQSVLAYC